MEAYNDLQLQPVVVMKKLDESRFLPGMGNIVIFSKISKISDIFDIYPIYTVSQKNWATFIFTVTLANVGRFLKFFQCRNQKEMAHNKNEKFPTVG